MKDIKLVIFDLDGTLIDAYPAIIKSFNFVMKKMDYPTQDARVIRRSVGWGDDRLLEPFIDLRDLKKALLLYRHHHRRALLKYSRLLPGAKTVLGYLKAKGYSLAIASNRPTLFSRILIRHLKIDKYFDYVLCADRLRHIKPHPEILNKIMHRSHIQPAQTVYVADMNIDARAARSAKVKSIIVTTGSSTLQEIKKQKPYLIIEHLRGILNIL